MGCHFLLQGIFPTQGSNPGIEPRALALQADTLSSEPPGKAIHSFQKDLVLDDLSIIELPNLELIEKNSETR